MIYAWGQVALTRLYLSFHVRLLQSLEPAQGISMSWDHVGPHMLENTCFPERKQDGEGGTAGDLSGQRDGGKKHFHALDTYCIISFLNSILISAMGSK